MVDLPSSAPLGSETPRIWTPPLRDLTPETSAGFSAVEFAENVLGLRLAPWQRWLFLHALELDEDGSFRFRTLVVLIARQNGKTTWMQVLALWRMYADAAPLVIGTAQNLDVAEEAWAGAVDMAESVPDLRREIASVDRTNGKKALRLESGERYKVAAASRRGGRGLSGDLVVLDELREHQSWDAWAAVTKTTMARPRPQIVCLSNAGDAQSVVLAHLRNQATAALAAGTGSVGIFEWSAAPECDLDDPQAWSQANPSLGWTPMSVESIQSARETDPEHVFRTEVLCQWVRDAEPTDFATSWPATETAESPSDPISFGVDVSPNGAAGAVVACGGGVLEVVDHRLGTTWLPARVAQLATDHRSTVWLDPSGPAGMLVPELERAGIALNLLTGGDMAKACGHMWSAVVDKTATHRRDLALDAAVAGATRRTAADAWRWNRRDSSVDISPLVAATVALWAWSSSQDAAYELLDSIR